MAFNYTRLLKAGMRGQDVAGLQESLRQLGYNPGPVDGIFGSRTKTAVIAFQRNSNLATDGIVGPNTVAALNRALGRGTAYLRLGSRGPAVRELQSDLAGLGYEPGPADGIFGSRTQNAVIAFQKDRGLSADGIVGPQTRSALETAPRRSEITTGILATAESLLGTPYLWGGDSPADGGFDCSGLVFYIYYRQYGIPVPRVSTEQYQTGTPVPLSSLQPGDLVFFDIYGSGTVDHVGIYTGNDNFISATSQGVTEYGLTGNSYWGPRYVGARRVY